MWDWKLKKKVLGNSEIQNVERKWGRATVKTDLQK